MPAPLRASTTRQSAIPQQPRGAVVSATPREKIHWSTPRTPLLWIDMHIAQRLADHVVGNRGLVGIPVHTAATRALPHRFRMEELASCLIEAIRSFQPEGPYYLGGWCNCGVLAYEVAQQFRRQGSEVALVIVIDSVNPVLYQRTEPSIIWASKVRFHLSQIIRLRMTEFGEYAGERVASIGWRRRQSSGGGVQFDARLDAAVQQYEPKPYPGRVVALYPSQLPSYRHPHANWADLVTGGFESYAVTGNHKTMMEESGVAELAARIENCIAGLPSAGDTHVRGDGRPDAGAVCPAT
ncbi:MAG: thioesterase domain-containing protein [Terriglobales bacterium]|jgi:thioesterase domain-containing protein